nr:hypothetical protein KS05_23960 [Rhizobium brockwellii]
MQDGFNALGMAHQNLACLCHDRTMSTPIDKLHLSYILQTRDADGKCRLGNMKRFGRLEEGAGAVDSKNIAQQSGIQVHLLTRAFGA